MHGRITIVLLEGRLRRKSPVTLVAEAVVRRITAVLVAGIRSGEVSVALAAKAMLR